MIVKPIYKTQLCEHNKVALLLHSPKQCQCPSWRKQTFRIKSCRQHCLQMTRTKVRKTRPLRESKEQHKAHQSLRKTSSTSLRLAPPTISQRRVCNESQYSCTSPARHSSKCLRAVTTQTLSFSEARHLLSASTSRANKVIIYLGNC